MARSIAPLISQGRSAEAELAWMFAEFHIAYDRYTQGKKAGQGVSIEEAWRRFCEGLVVVMDGQFVPRLDRTSRANKEARSAAKTLAYHAAQKVKKPCRN